MFTIGHLGMFSIGQINMKIMRIFAKLGVLFLALWVAAVYPIVDGLVPFSV